MARGVNKVILLGNLGDDPEVKYTQGGMAVTSLRLATTSVRKDRDGNPVEETQWHRVKMFGKLAEIAGEYLTKGSQVFIEGTIRYSQHQGDDGTTRYYTDVIANEMQMLGSRGGDGGSRAPRDGGGNRTRGSDRGSDRGAERPQRQAAQPPLDDFADDDIPF